MGQNIKTLKGKRLAKHETEAIWDYSNNGAGVAYIPDLGEEVFYDPDDQHSYVRVKYGDGQHIVKDLPFSTDQSLDKTGGMITGDLRVTGDFVVDGDASQVHLENVNTPQNIITLRDDAAVELLDGEYTGLVAKKYDGVNDGMLVFDKDGTAYVGDVGNIQPLATRAPETEMQDGKVLNWNATKKRLESTAKNVVFESEKLNEQEIAYSRDIPVSSAKYASVDIVGGMTRKCENLIDPQLFAEHSTNTTLQDDVFTTSFTNGALHFNLDKVNPYPAGTYTFSIRKVSESLLAVLMVYACDSGSALTSCPIDGDADFTFTADTDFVVTMAGYYTPNADKYGTFSYRVQLVKGEVALPYEPYFDGLRSAPVTEVKSVGANIFGGDALADRLVEVADAVKDEATGIVRFYAGSVGDKLLFDGFKPNTQYTFILNGWNEYGAGTNLMIAYTDDTVDYLPFPYSQALGTSAFKSQYGKTIKGLYGVMYASYTNLYYGNCGIFEGAITADAFKPYREEFLPIPEAVQNLDGYGQSNPDNSEEYNYIDFEQRKFVVCGHLVDGSWVKYDKAQETDISDILPSDNFIGVEGKGTLTFKNEYEYDVPSIITVATGAHDTIGADAVVGDLTGTAARAISDKNGRDIVDTYVTKTDLPKYGSKTAQGAYITLQDAETAKLRGLIIYGKSMQNGTPTPDAPIEIESVGKLSNLWSGEISAQSATTSYTFQDGTMTLRRNGGSIQAFVWSKEKYKAGTYNLSFTLSMPAAMNFRINTRTEASATAIGTSIQTYYVSGNCSLVITLAEDSYIGFGTDADNTTITASNIMLNKGSTALTYKPYTGLPELKTEITGANLFDANKATIGYRCNTDGSLAKNGLYATSDYIEVNGGTSYFLTNVCGNTYTSAVQFNANKDIVGDIVIGDGSQVSGTLTVGSDVKYIRINIYTDETDMNTVMVSKGSTALPYEPYTGQSMIHTLTEPLRGIGDIRDEIDYARGKRVTRIGSVVLDGINTKVSKNNGVQNDSNYTYFYSIPIKSDGQTPPLCTHLTGGKNVQATTIGWSSGSKSILFMGFKLLEGVVGNNSTEVNAWLSANPMTVCYALDEPIETDLTDEEMAEYKKLHTNYPTTLITSEGAEMKVSYTVPGALPSNTSLAHLIDDKWHRVVSDYDIARWNAVADLLQSAAEEATF